MFACKQDLELQDMKGFWLESGFFFEKMRVQEAGFSDLWLYHAVKFLDAPLQYIYIYIFFF